MRVTAATCPYCGLDASSGNDIVASERMYGMGGQFHYRECPHCGSLALENPPNLAAYYPADYYAFDAVPGRSAAARLARLLRTAIDRVEWTMPPLAGRRHVVALARMLGLRRESSVLDVGCGSGGLLRRFRRLGLNKLVGVDPYVPAPVDEPGLRIVRGTLGDISGRFDIVFFNHSLEHAVDPERMLRRAGALLTPAGALIVRTPVVNYAWRRFRECWVQLDAPRHLTIPSVEGMHALAPRVDLSVERIVFDSTAFQFWGSKAYQRGASLASVVRPPFSLGWFRLVVASAGASLHATFLNAAGQGDQAAFICRPVGANT